MSLPFLFVALTLFSQQGGTSQDSVFPTKPAEQAPSADILNWHGLAYLQGTPGVAPKIYDTAADWTDIKTRSEASKAAKGVPWHLKVVIFTRIESDQRDDRGVLREHRQTIESVQLAQIQASLTRLKAWVSAKFSGRVSLVPDIQIESDWVRDNVSEANGGFGGPFAQTYFEARINGGVYEAEDKLFRGPFNSVMYVLPGSRSGATISTKVNGMPVAGLSSLPIQANGMFLSLDAELRSTWLQQVEIRTKEQGFKGIALSSGKAGVEDAWPIACSLDDAPPTAYVSRLSSALELGPACDDPTSDKTFRMPETDATAFADPDRGQVLKVVESAGYRTGGFALPARADGMPIAKVDSMPTLSFQAKSASIDPLSIRLDSSDGKTAWISVGRDPRLVDPMPGVDIAEVPFNADGKWQKISVDLKPILQKIGMTDIVRMAIEPSPNAKLAGKLRADPIEYEFDEIKFSADSAAAQANPITADSNSDDPEARALFAAVAKAPSPDLAILLKDKNELVRLNATAAYATIKDPSVESSFVSNSLDLDPSIAAMALRALMLDGSDSAVAVVRRSVRIGFSDYAKQTAAELLAQTKDSKMAGEVTLLWSNRSWNARLSGVTSMDLFQTPESHKMMLAFLVSDDPEIKLAVTRRMDPSNDDDVRKLLWSAVNEPSDLVRAESDIKLIQSPTASNRTEGYKGVRDDSVFVRLTVLEYLALQPKDENRNALRMAIVDKSSAVRAASIRAMATLSSTTSLDEIANVLDDPYPVVQLALIELSKKKNLKLPQKTLDAMAASPDTRVLSAIKSLGA